MADTKQTPEHGAIIIEATLTLSFFMFAIFTLLSVIQVAYAQSRMSVALCSATKSIAEYAHIYYATGMDQALSGTGGKSSDLFGEIGDFLETVGGELGPISEELSNFMSGAGRAAGETSITTLLKNEVGSELVVGLMDTNLGDGSEGSAKAFKKHYRIEDVNLLESRVLENGSGNIYFRVKYKIKVIKLLNIDYAFNMSSWAYTDAWGDTGSTGSDK